MVFRNGGNGTWKPCIISAVALYFKSALTALSRSRIGIPLPSGIVNEGYIGGLFEDEPIVLDNQQERVVLSFYINPIGASGTSAGS